MTSAAFPENDFLTLQGLQKISGKPRQSLGVFSITVWSSRQPYSTVSGFDTYGSFVPNPAFTVAQRSASASRPLLPLFSLFPYSVTTLSYGLELV